MISITELWCGRLSRGHDIRYNKPRPAGEIRPVVVWNATMRCNLACIHCYSDSPSPLRLALRARSGQAQPSPPHLNPPPQGGRNNSKYPPPQGGRNYRRGEDELTTDEAKALIDDLASFGVPCLIVSGGEPLMRDDLIHILTHAKARGLPTAISTNGILIDIERARLLKEAGVKYVGISLDGIGEGHDKFRGSPGAFDRACEAFINLKEFNVRCGIRFTLTKQNLNYLPQLFDFAEELSIERICFYHLVPVGRGADIKHLIPSKSETRGALDSIILWAEELASFGSQAEVLTVDNFADNIYLYLKSRPSLPPTLILPPEGGGDVGILPHEGGGITGGEKGGDILALIRANGGAQLSSGVGIGCIDCQGKVHPDQFWPDCTLGNIRERPFSQIWTDPENKMLADLRNRIPLIRGRCGRCRWLNLCGGGLRSRACAVTGDPWAEDPGCYLSDEEI